MEGFSLRAASRHGRLAVLAGRARLRGGRTECAHIRDGSVHGRGAGAVGMQPQGIDRRRGRSGSGRRRQDSGHDSVGRRAQGIPRRPKPCRAAADRTRSRTSTRRSRSIRHFGLAELAPRERVADGHGVPRPPEEGRRGGRQGCRMARSCRSRPPTPAPTARRPEQRACSTSSSPRTRRTSARTSRSARSCSASRIRPPRSSTSRRPTTIAPNYSAPYNQMGYAYRQVGDYDNAEQAFKKYIELIPNDPNPYDSYGELLLKMGRFDDSIVQYRKALAIDANFLASHMGISADLIYLGKTAEAAAEIEQIAEKARNDAEPAHRHVRDDLARGLHRKDGRRRWRASISSTRSAKERRHAGDGRETCRRGPRSHRDGESGGGAGRCWTRPCSSRPRRCRTRSRPTTSVPSQRPLAWRWPARVNRGEGRGRRILEDRAVVRQQLQVTPGARVGGMIALQRKTGTRPSGTAGRRASRTRTTTIACAWRIKGKGDTASAAEHSDGAAHFNPLPELNFSFIHAKAAKIAATKS